MATPSRASVILQRTIEVIVLFLIVCSPWVLGGVEPGAECALFLGVSLVVVLWAVQQFLQGELRLAYCPVSLGLGGLFLLGVIQLVPLPAGVLAVVSPEAARLHAELLPSTPEVLPFGEQHDPSPYAAGNSLSVHPAETRLALTRLLAVLLLFLVVRNQMASLEATRRLAIVALANGGLLALFALAQLFSSPPNTVYWTIPVVNSPFGPFICRNHFPFYVNMCIGLGIGLLLSFREESGPGQGGLSQSLLDLLQSPRTLWVGLAVILMLSSVFFSLSRGGILSLGISLVVCLGLRFAVTGRISLGAISSLVLAGVVLVLLWAGMDSIRERLATVWSGAALEDGRLPLWSDVLQIARDFPIFGAGYGSFLVTELHYRSRSDHFDEGGYDNAHNDYLEALTEGGILRLVLSLLLIVLIYRAGWRAMNRLRNCPEQGLVAGLLFAFTTVVVHSFVDFGLHIPAIALLATVLSANLTALGGGTSEQSAADSAELRIPGRAFAAVAVLIAILLGGAMTAISWRIAQAYALEVAAREYEGETEPEALQKRAALLEQACQVAPDRAIVRLMAGQAYLDLYQANLARQEQMERLSEVAQLIGVLPTTPGVAAVPAALLGMAARRPMESRNPLQASQTRQQLAQEALIPSLRHYLAARDLCPLIAKAQVQLAAHVDWLPQADPKTVYMERAKRAVPHSSEVWYLAGLLAFREDQDSEAARDWKQSLELSPRYLPAILDRARGKWNDTQLLHDVLPEDPRRIIQAMTRLYPEQDDAQREPFLRRALALFQKNANTSDGEELALRAEVESQLDDENAADSYEKALRFEPSNTRWRYQLAQLHIRKGRLRDAQRELRTVLAQKPNYPGAKQQLETISRKLAEID